MKRTVFIDRDGVINKRPVGDWVKSWDEFKLLDGVPQALHLLKAAGCRLILITNQRCLALGLIDNQQLERIHQNMNELIEEKGGARLDDIFVCPHDRHEECDCRKPRPGLIFQAAARYSDIVLEECPMFGDRDTDEQAAAAAGCGTFFRVSDDKSFLDCVREYLS